MTITKRALKKSFPSALPRRSGRGEARRRRDARRAFRGGATTPQPERGGSGRKGTFSTPSKLGHSCLLIKENGVTLITDPGTYTAEAMKGITGLDAILVTDEHQDHFDMASIETLRATNPGVRIFTQKSVQKLLADKNIPSELVLDKQAVAVKGVSIEGCGEKHAVLHSSIPPSDNTGYVIAGRLFHPGDALTLPNKPIEILALPIAGPWLKMSEAIDYAIAAHPKVAFPIHDGRGSFTALFEKILPEHGIEFRKPDGEMNF